MAFPSNLATQKAAKIGQPIGLGPPLGPSRGSRLPTLNLPLYDAAIAGDLDQVKTLASSGHTIDERDHGGWTPFLKACEFGHLEVAKFLVEKGASVHQESSFHWTALHQAAGNGHLKVVNWLIKEGVAVDACDNEDKLTPLWKAVSGGHVPVCEALVKEGANLAHVNREETPLLIQAAYKGHIAVVEYLIAQGADPIQTVDENYGNTLFLTACKWGHLELVEWIMKHVKGVKVNQTNRYGSHAMNHAVQKSHLPLAKFLVKSGWKIPTNPHESPLIGCEDLEIAKYFVETLKLPLDVCSQYGTSPLAQAAYNGHLDVVKYFIQQGANPNYKGKPDASTALQTAEMNKGDPKVDAIIAYLKSL